MKYTKTLEASDFKRGRKGKTMSMPVFPGSILHWILGLDPGGPTRILHFPGLCCNLHFS